MPRVCVGAMLQARRTRTVAARICTRIGSSARSGHFHVPAHAHIVGHQCVFHVDWHHCDQRHNRHANSNVHHTSLVLIRVAHGAAHPQSNGHAGSRGHGQRRGCQIAIRCCFCCCGHGLGCCCTWCHALIVTCLVILCLLYCCCTYSRPLCCLLHMSFSSLLWFIARALCPVKVIHVSVAVLHWCKSKHQGKATKDETNCMQVRNNHVHRSQGVGENVRLRMKINKQESARKCIRESSRLYKQRKRKRRRKVQ